MATLGGKQAVSQEILRCFWDLSDVDQVEPPLILLQDTRWKALQRLVSAAVSSQERFAPPEDPSQLSPLLSYCLSRLLRGLASANYQTRESSSIGCTVLLKHLPFIPCSDYLSLMQQHLPLKTDGADTGHGEVVAARALAYSVALKIEYHRESTEAMIQLVDGVLELYPHPSVREICAVTLADMLPDCDAEALHEVCKKCPDLCTLLHKPVAKATAEDLVLSLKLWDQIPREVLNSCSILPPIKEQQETELSRMDSGAWSREASKAFFERSHLEKLIAGLAQSVTRHPHIHSVWESVLSLLLCDVDKFGLQQVHQKIQNFWEILIHPLAAASTPKLFLAMCLSLKILPRLNPCYLPFIIRGKYWEKLHSVLQLDAEPLGECASECFDQILSMAKQCTADQATWEHVLLFCRLPHNSKCRSIKQDLLKCISSEAASDYAADLMQEFLMPGSTEHCSGFEKEEMLRDLRTLMTIQKLHPPTVQEIVQFLVAMGLFTVDKRGSKSNKQLRRFRKSKTEMTPELRQQCVICLMHVYPSLDPSLLTVAGSGGTVCLLGAAVKLHSLPGVELARETAETERERLSMLADLSKFLETLLQDTKDELKLKRVRAMHDLLSVIQLYAFGNAETVSATVIEDLSQLVALLFGSSSEMQEAETESTDSEVPSVASEIEEAEEEDTAEDSEEHYMDIFVTVMIELCARSTDPYSIRLMMKYAKSLFAVFCGDLTFPSWIRMLSVLTTPDDLGIDQESQPPADDDSSAGEASLPDIKSEVESMEEIKSEEDEEMSIAGSDDDLNDVFDASPLLDEKKRSIEEASLMKKLDEEMGCASTRVLSLIEHVIKKHAKKDVTLLAPVYLMRALIMREDDQKDTGLVQKQLQQRLERLLTASLKCRPELAEEDLPLIQVQLETFLEEIPRKTSRRDAVSRVVLFLILRLLSRNGSSSCKQLAVVLMKQAISQQFGRVPVLYGNTLPPLLSQYCVLRHGVLQHLVQCGRQSNRAPQKIKALEFINICLKDRETTALVPIVESSELGEFFMELLEMKLTGRMQLELLQELVKALRLLQKVSQPSAELSLPFGQMREHLEKKSETEKTAKLKRKWNQLIQSISTTT